MHPSLKRPLSGGFGDAAGDIEELSSKQARHERVCTRVRARTLLTCVQQPCNAPQPPMTMQQQHMATKHLHCPPYVHVSTGAYNNNNVFSTDRNTVAAASLLGTHCVRAHTSHLLVQALHRQPVVTVRCSCRPLWARPVRTLPLTAWTVQRRATNNQHMWNSRCRSTRTVSRCSTAS